MDDFLPDHLTVRVGSTYNDKGGKVIKVVDIIEHPKYSFVSYDFAILQLDDEESLPSVARPIKLPEETDIAKTGQMMMVSGWGQTLNALESFDILRAVDVPIVSTRKCKSWYGTSNPITDQMICAGFRKGGERTSYNHKLFITQRFTFNSRTRLVSRRQRGSNEAKVRRRSHWNRQLGHRLCQTLLSGRVRESLIRPPMDSKYHQNLARSSSSLTCRL